MAVSLALSIFLKNNQNISAYILNFNPLMFQIFFNVMLKLSLILMSLKFNSNIEMGQKFEQSRALTDYHDIDYHLLKINHQHLS